MVYDISINQGNNNNDFGYTVNTSLNIINLKLCQFLTFSLDLQMRFRCLATDRCPTKIKINYFYS